MPVEIIKPANVHKPSGYSHAVKVGNTIYVAGQGPYDEKGNLVGKGDYYAQQDQMWKNMQNVLEAAGASMANVVRMHFFIAGKHEDNGEIFRKYFKKPYTPGTSVGCAGLPNPDQWVISDCIAVID